MPIYEYICSECDSKFEQLRPLSQSGQAVDCPKCHKPARRKMSTFACFTATAGGASRTVPGTGSSCASCTSGNCSTCAS